MKANLIETMGSDLTVVNAARVSYGKHKEQLDEKDKRLIRYLAKHKHTSPFGHCFATFHIRAPIFVARQLVKHKFLRINEISRRYVDSEPEFYYPSEYRGRPVDSKQGSDGVVATEHGIIGQSVWHNSYQSVKLYTYLLNRGVCPEQARMVLPQNMYTEWYWSGSLDAFSDMCNLRCKRDTQHETQTIANEVSNCLLSVWPVSWSALASIS